MRRSPRKALMGATAALLAVPLLPGAPAAAAALDCKIVITDVTGILRETNDCIHYILSAISLPDLPPHV